MLSSSFVDMRNRNAVRILKAVRQQPELSRADVARICDLAKSTVSSVVDEFVESSILQETGSKASKGGRCPVGLIFNAAARLSLGISVDSDRIEIALCDLDGSIHAVRTKKYAGKKTAHAYLAAVLLEVQRSLRRENMLRSHIAAIGLSVPGPLPATRGLPSDTDAMDYAQLQALLSRELECAVVLDSNTNMAALAESRLGVLHESEEVLVVRLSDEVRSALITGRKLYQGAKGRAGELGHIKLPNIKGDCKCGSRGCINTVAGTEAIVDECRLRGAAVDDIDGVVAAAIEGSEIVSRVLAGAGKAIAYGIANCINILAPTDLIVTGRLIAAGDAFLLPLRTAVGELSSDENLRNCNLVFDDSRNHIEAIGASLAALAQDSFLLSLVSSSTGKLPQVD